MPLSKKQIAVILAMKKKKGEIVPPPKNPSPPIDMKIAKVPPIAKIDKVDVPKPPKTIKFPKLRIKMGIK